MKYLYSLIIILLCLTTPLQAQEFFLAAEPAPKHEVRAVWVTTLGGLDWPKAKASTAEGRERQKQELCQLLDKLKACRINTVFLQTRVRGTTIYPSNIEPWDIALTGQYDKNPGYDPLAFAIEETHKRGMELHAWVVTIPVFKIVGAQKVGKTSLLKTHPELLKKHRDQYYLDPGLPGTADYLVSICKEIVSHYDIDGIHFDYIRYPEEAALFPDGVTYKKYGKGANKAAWRRDNVTNIVRKTHNAIKGLKPWIRLSCSPVGKYRDVSRYSAKGWAAYSTVHQDAQGWLKEGIMDMLCPMMYFQGDHFFPFAADWQENSYGRTVAPGLGIYFMHPNEKDWPWGVIQRELCYLRQQKLGGQAYFRSQFLTDNTKGIYDYLQRSFYPYPALLPPMIWQQTSAPAIPQVKQHRTGPKSAALRWQQIDNGGAPCRYVIYASNQVPIDTSNPANIVMVTNETEYNFNLLSATLYNLHFAVTALDRFGLESQPSEVATPTPSR